LLASWGARAALDLVSSVRGSTIRGQAGLSPQQALTAATANVADAFGLEDCGIIAAGRRADLLLVRGDPGKDITASRDIVTIWRNGVAFDRSLHDEE
jgi:imidazolonepropionase-like amidohydrolase